jgi:hypothetical protein
MAAQNTLGMMELPRSRGALKHAEVARSEMLDARNQPSDFEYRFAACMGFLHRVGTTINDETQEIGRTPAFGEWWHHTEKDSLHRYMTDIRHAELKRSEVTYEKRVGLRGLGILSWRRRRMQRLNRLPTASVGQHHIRHSAVDRITPSNRVTGTPGYQYSFAMGEYEGQDVVALVNRYLEWLGGYVLPTAEKLMDRDRHH